MTMSQHPTQSKIKSLNKRRHPLTISTAHGITHGAIHVKSRRNVGDGRIETDVILPIKREHLSRIISREKNHEYRKYRLKDGVERIWLYETAGGGKEKCGAAAISHIAIIPANTRYTPGQVPETPAGIGNAEFNAGLKVSNYAYPIINLYEIVPAVPLSEMKSEWGMGAPMGWMYLRKELWEAKWGVTGKENPAIKRLF